MARVTLERGSLPPARRGVVLATALAALFCALAFAAPAARAASLRYFGYFGARIPPSGDHLLEVAGRSNLNWIQISDPDRYRPEVLEHCAPAGCIVSTGFEFFRNCTGVHNPECELYPDYAARWRRLAEAVSTRIDRVGAFYLMDEPQYRGATRAELETAAAKIKATYPTIPVMMVEAGPQVTPTLQVPTNVDWVGFDWYCQPFSTIEEKLAVLTSRVSPTQSLFLVPEAAPLAACGGDATDAELARLQYRYYELALRNPRVVGLLAFGFWTSGYGSAQLPLTVAAHQDIFARILAANQPPPAPPTPPAPAPAPAPPTSPAPAPASAPPTSPPAARERPARIAGERAWLTAGGRIALRLRCPAGNRRRCHGGLWLTRPHDRRRPRVIGARRFDLAPASAATVVVRAKKPWRPRLRRLTRRGRAVTLRAKLDSGLARKVELVRRRQR